jgi:Protein of unknown function (DUF3891)
MVVRELRDGSSIVSTQEDHAELSAQFAAHWGNQEFSRLQPYDSMVFATTYHDSGYREWEGNPPINLAKGRPYAHRETIPAFEAIELQAYAKNVEWVASHDRYAGLLVSMHRTGLWENRYNAFSTPKGRVRERSLEVKAAKQALEQKQQEEKTSLGRGSPAFAEGLWYNFVALQIYDLLSLYFCCDGYGSDDQFKEDLIAPVPVAYGSKEQVELRIVPVGRRTVRFAPYPFDISPFTVAVRARTLPATDFASADEALAAFHRGVRQLLTFEIVS